MESERYIVQFSTRTIYLFSLLLNYACRTLYHVNSVDTNDVWVINLMTVI